MRAVRFYKAGEPLKVEDVPIPTINRDEVLVKVKAAGICHTDLHFLDGTLIPWKGTLPMTLGHEIAGEVSEIGEAVSGFKTGDRVAVYNGISCGECKYCQMGRENLCVELDQIGFTLDGGYAEYVKTKANTLVLLPGNVSYESGAILTCGAGSTYHALMDIGKLKSGEYVVINGFGGLGATALQVARSAGANVVAVDVSDEKLREAQKLGALGTINALKENVGERVKEITNGVGADLVLELVGIEKTMQNALDGLGKTGRLVIVGYTKDQFKALPLLMVINEWAIYGSVAYTLKDLKNVVELAEKGRISPLITLKSPLEKVGDTLLQLKEGKILGRAIATPS